MEDAGGVLAVLLLIYVYSLVYNLYADCVHFIRRLCIYPLYGLCNVCVCPLRGLCTYSLCTLLLPSSSLSLLLLCLPPSSTSSTSPSSILLLLRLSHTLNLFLFPFSFFPPSSPFFSLPIPLPPKHYCRSYLENIALEGGSTSRSLLRLLGKILTAEAVKVNSA